MQDANPAGTYQYGIIYEMGYHLQGLVATHTTYVYVLMEVEVFLSDLILRLAANEGNDRCLWLILAGILGTFQL